MSSPINRQNVNYRPSYGWATVAALAVFALYIATLAPSTAMWDASEYLAAVKVLGLPHPPGNPLFMLLGHSFGLLPIPVGYAERINMMVALASALSAGLWFLVTERVLERWLPARWQRVAGATVAALVGATSFTVWNQSVVAEKVYAVSLLGIALVSWIMVRWCHSPDTPGSGRLLVLVAYLTGLGYSNHPAGFLVIPAVGIAILALRPRILLRWRLMATCLAVFGLGLTPFLYEPIRSAHFPALNEGEPTGCATRIEWNCTVSGLTLQRLSDNINRSQYGKPRVVERQAPLTAQVGLLWTYFEWQWLRDAHGEHSAAQSGLAILFLVLGSLGAREHWRRDRRTFWYFGPLVVTLTLALVVYLNFRYSWGQAPELGRTVSREPRERDYFFIWTFSAWSVWTALGIVSLWHAAARVLGAPPIPPEGAPHAESAHRRSWLLATPVLALALIPLIGNATQAPRHGQTFTRDWAVDLLNSVEPYAILITNGDNDTFPLWYAQEVEGIRRDVIVAVTTYVEMDWFARQLIRRPVAEYDSVAGPALYRGREWEKPDGPPLRMSLGEADSIPPYVELGQPMRFVQGPLTTSIGPGYLTRGQVVVLRMIKDSYPGRPLYFTGGDFARQLGFAPYLLTQGLVQKLMPDSVKSGPGIIATPLGYLDIARSQALWTRVYRAPESLIREGDWVDRPSAGIPLEYALLGETLAQVLAQRGENEEAGAVMHTVDGMARAARLQGYISTISR